MELDPVEQLEESQTQSAVPTIHDLAVSDEMEVDPLGKTEHNQEIAHAEPFRDRSITAHPAANPLSETDELDLVPKKQHENHHAESISPDIELAAAAAAGLKSSGFDEDMVLNDPVFSRPSSRAGGLEEPDFDDFPQHASRKNSQRNSRRGSRAQSMERGEDAKRELGQEKIGDDEFAAIVTAGLHGAGFNPDRVTNDKDEPPRSNGIDLTEISGMKNSKSAWNTLTKSASEESIKGGTDQFSRGAEIQSEDIWQVPVQKTRKNKKKKGSKNAKESALTNIDPSHDANTTALGVGLLAAGVAAAVHDHERHDSNQRRELPIDAIEGSKRPASIALDESAAPPPKILKEVDESHDHDPVTAKDLAQSSWSFAGNRDSGIEVEDSPMLPTSGARQSMRDSGFHDAPFTPTAERERRGSHSSPKSPMKIQVEVPSDWNVTVGQGSPQKDVPGEEIHGVQNGTKYKSVFGSPTSPDGFKGTRTAETTRALGDIMEIDPSSPLAKKTHRAMSPRGLGISPRDRAVSPSSMVSVDELLARRSWPPVDEDNETVGINAVLSRSKSKSTSTERRAVSQPHALHHNHSRGDLRTPSNSSEHLSRSLNRAKSPNTLHPTRSASHSLRRIRSARSGDLRDMSRSGGTVSPKESSDHSIALAGAGLAGAVLVAGALSSGRDHNKPRLDMEGVYVSSALRPRNLY
jgi:hypothetical protein